MWHRHLQLHEPALQFPSEEIVHQPVTKRKKLHGKRLQTAGIVYA
jgi:hypothetical protein